MDTPSATCSRYRVRTGLVEDIHVVLRRLVHVVPADPEGLGDSLVVGVDGRELPRRILHFPVNHHASSGDGGDGQRSVEIEGLDLDIAPVEVERRVFRDLHALGGEELAAHFLERRGERRRQDDFRADPRGHTVKDLLSGLRHMDAQKLQFLAEHAVNRALRRRCALGKAGFLVLSSCIHSVVLDSSEARPSLELRETDLGVAAQQAGVVLHHALEASGFLEGSLALVLEFRVHELRHLASRFLQHFSIWLDPEDEGVGISGVGRKAALVWYVPFRADGGFEEGLQLVVLDVDGELLARLLVLQVANRADRLPRPSRHRQRVNLQPETLRDSDKSRGSLEYEPICVLEEHDPPAPLRRPLRGQSRLVQQRVNVAMPVRLREHGVRVFRVHSDTSRPIHDSRHLLLLD
mmetsp:Transcript_22206/g.41626  ORF Transcript_22206/g.41626 Transcript_22206/m.41626 type:complete len:407 (-) Transcript_22206:294-1514(-)